MNGQPQRFLCPVCGFDGLVEPPFDVDGTPSHEICPCCGVEFGFDDRDDFAEFRQNWIEQGAPWFTPKIKPKGWDLQKQLAKLKD